ncbi:MAG: bacillithiol biosynthesis cysteine-adding enzyme BshC [Chitinophagaceae bacterium]
MDCTSTSIPYQQIGSFSKIIVDYINGASDVQPFYKHPVSLDGIRKSIESRKAFANNRELLVEVLEQQYKEYDSVDGVHHNIQALLNENSFTIVTAHQPNIFTGYLYFIYKILHIIKLSVHLGKEMPEFKFVPVYYMGSEDADLDELGHIFLNGEKLIWETSQEGAVGRMRNDGLEKIIDRISSELSVLPFGGELVDLLKKCYLESADVQTATFRLVHNLFADYGLIVVLPDNPKLKAVMKRIFEDDLLNQGPSSIVEQTIHDLSGHYKVQAKPREINLFYLEVNIRERIIKQGDTWKVVGTNIAFSQAELLQELNDYPERFSPNVILRGLFQETILPNIAFIGGGGETAYWLELKDLFGHYSVPYPVLILRNSFLFIEKRWMNKIGKLGFELTDLFKDERTLIEQIVKKESEKQLDLSAEINQLTAYYNTIRQLADKIDSTLNKHVEALQTRVVKQLHILEKKMLKAEKRKFDVQQKQVYSIKEKLFPKNGLQERVDNFMPYYAKFGKEFIRMIYDHSPALEQEFVIIAETLQP